MTLVGTRGRTTWRSSNPGILCFLLMVLLAGCASGRVGGAPTATGGAIPVDPRRDEASRDGDYLIREGDVLDIKFFYHKDLNERVVVRPDGRISLQLVDDIVVAGMRPMALGKILGQKYAVVLQQPQVAVIVREFAGQKVYVGGEVNSPKIVSLGEEMTALQAILGAGGFRDTANLASVIVISRGPNNAPAARTINLKRVLSGEAPEGDSLLRPFDVVFVPKTFVAEANRFVEQYITKMIPGTLTGGFSYTVVEGKQIVTP